MAKEQKAGLSMKFGEFWHPLSLYNNLKTLFFSIIPRNSKVYAILYSTFSVFLKKLNIINLYYRQWIRQYDSPSQESFQHIRELIKKESLNQSFSIVMPVFNPPIALLDEAIQSVLAQVYPHWELCISDDASTDKRVHALLESYAEKDGRIKVVFRKENGHISAASNSALELAEHEFLVLLDHDDILHPLALYYVSKAIQTHPDCEILYSDEDKITKGGRRLDPYFKPDFDYELLLSQNMVSHLGVYRTATVRKIGGFRIGLEGSQDYDLVLRVLEHCTPNQIHHIPRPLYHWRLFRQSAARALSIKPYAANAAEKALKQHLERKDIKADVKFLPELAAYAVSYDLPDKKPEVAILILNDQTGESPATLIDILIENTNYPKFKIFSPQMSFNANGIPDLPGSWIGKVEAIPVDMQKYDTTAKQLNYCVNEISSEYICFVDSRVDRFSSNWLSILVGQAIQKGIGVVGPRLLYQKSKVYSNGLVLLPEGVAKHLARGKDASDNGYFGWSKLIRGYSALTMECLLVNRYAFQSAGGFSDNFQSPLALSVDLCLKFREAGYRNILQPGVKLYLDRGISSQSKDWAAQDMPKNDINSLLERWAEWFHKDPSFNPNLTVLDEGKVMVNLSRVDGN